MKISGFGNFQIRTKAPRPGRNPRTGEAIPIGAPAWRPSTPAHKLKEQIQGEHRSGRVPQEVEWSARHANNILGTRAVPVE